MFEEMNKNWSHQPDQPWFYDVPDDVLVKSLWKSHGNPQWKPPTSKSGRVCLESVASFFTATLCSKARAEPVRRPWWESDLGCNSKFHMQETRDENACLSYLYVFKNLYMTCNKEDPMITMFLFKALVFYDFATLDLMMVMLTYGPCSLLSHGGTNSRDSTLARLPFSDLYSLSKGDDWVRTAKRC